MKLAQHINQADAQQVEAVNKQPAYWDIPQFMHVLPAGEEHDNQPDK